MVCSVVKLFMLGSMMLRKINFGCFFCNKVRLVFVLNVLRVLKFVEWRNCLSIVIMVFELLMISMFVFLWVLICFLW